MMCLGLGGIVIEATCSRRDTPQCATCARRGEGDYFALVKIERDKRGRPVEIQCLSYRRSDEARGQD